MEDRFDSMSRSFDSLANIVDVYSRKSEMYHHEMLVLNHKADRSEKWIHTIADKVSLKIVA